MKDKTTEDKLKLVTHYIIDKCEDSQNFGSVKLNKILWFADVIAYRHWGVSVTGSKYIRRKMGPVPDRILAVRKQLEDEGKITITHPKYMYDSTLFKSKEKPVLTNLSEDEIELLDLLSDQICNEFSATEISNVSHDDVWNAAVDGEEIPLTATLVSDPGDYRFEVQSWANEVVANHG